VYYRSPKSARFSARLLEQYENAIDDYNQVIKLDPEFTDAYYNKACIYALQNKVDEVLIYLRQALEINCQKYCDLSKDDSDFDKIRGNTDFQKLLKELCD